MSRSMSKLTSILLAAMLAVSFLPARAFAVGSEPSDEGLLPSTREADAFAVDTLEAEGASVIAISVGSTHSAAIKSDGSLWTWGDNVYGELGNGTTANHIKPVKIMDDVSSVSLGDMHSAAIKKDGTLWMWGGNKPQGMVFHNCGGQLGDGTTTNRLEPVKIMDDVSSVSLGEEHSAAIKKDGSLWMWGCNHSYQLGDGTETTRLEPVKIMDGVASVSLGFAHSAAIKKDGTLWMWGHNSSGQLGDGTTTDRPTPVKIMDGVASVSLGFAHSAAIKKDGTLWIWGANDSGQMGSGDTLYTDHLKPVKIMSDVASVALGSSTSSAIKTDGTLWEWGRYQYGENGYIIDSRRTPVKTMSSVSSISAGTWHSVALRKNGTVWAWGGNQYNQIGDGTTLEFYNDPVMIIPSKTVRLYGQDALSTMQSITSEGFAKNSCGTVVVATMGGYWDALAASGLAGLYDCPVLLTDGSSLSSQTKAEIKRLGASRAYIAGGTAAVSANVERQIKALGLSTARLAGSTAVDTAVEIYEKGAGSWGKTAIVATAQSYHDALAASPYAYAKGAPVFLTNSSNKLDNGVLGAIKAGKFETVIICGGTAAVSKSVESQLGTIGVTKTKRLWGATAYETAVAVSEWCLSNGMDSECVGVATGTDYYDALTGASLCGAKNAPLVLVGNGNDSAASFLKSNRTTVEQVYVFGGPAAVSIAESNAINSALK